MKNKVVAMYLIILVFVFVAPVNAKVIYGPGTAPTTGGPLYDQDGNVYYYNQPSRGEDSTATAIVGILGAIISSVQQNKQEQRQEQQNWELQEKRKHIEELDRQIAEIYRQYDSACKDEAQVIAKGLVAFGIGESSKWLLAMYTDFGWHCNMAQTDRHKIILYGRHVKNMDIELAVVYDTLERTVLVARQLPPYKDIQGVLIYERAPVVGNVGP